jgi:hypothetical protein
MDSQPTICCDAECRYKRSLFRLTHKVEVSPPSGLAPNWPVYTLGGRFYAEIPFPKPDRLLAAAHLPTKFHAKSAGIPAGTCIHSRY